MRTCIILLFSILWAGIASAHVRYPPDAGIINIKSTYGAIGNGVTDDTAAIRQAVDDHAGHLRILYFPNGTYRISDSIVFPQDTFFITFQGACEENVIIRLEQCRDHDCDRHAGAADDSRFHPGPSVATTLCPAAD